MQADKKKLIVIATLALVIVCVGVFQFVVGSGAPAPAPVVKKDEKPKGEADVVEPVEEAKNPLFAAALPPRDPFQTALDAETPKDPPPQPAQATPKSEPRAPKLPPVEINTSGKFSDGGTAPVMINKVPEETFAFSLSGVMLGARPIAVFTDSQGNQRMIPVGGSLDAESKVLEVEKNAVTVRFHGKTLRLTVEGNPNDK